METLGLSLDSSPDLCLVENGYGTGNPSSIPNSEGLVSAGSLTLTPWASEGVPD